MTVGVKYYAKGAAVPGSFTNIQVLECEIRSIWRPYDTDTSVDGTLSFYKREYKRARLKFHIPYDSTAYAVYAALINAYYVRIDDSRYASTNTIDFILDGEPEVGRSGRSRVLESLAVNLISEAPI